MGLLKTLGLIAPRPTGASGATPDLGALAAADTGRARAAGDAPGTGAGATPPPVDKNLAAYTTARAAAQKVVDDLGKHPQAAKIPTQIAQAKAKLTEADTLATAKDYAQAGKRLVEARTICAAAKTIADSWVVYLREYTSMKALGMSFDAINASGTAGAVQPFLDQADALVATTPPNFVAAQKKLREIGTALQPAAKRLIDRQKAKLATMEKMDKGVREFSKKDIAEAKVFIAEAERALAAKDWSVCRQNALAAADVVGPGVRMGERRGLYDKQRVTTVAAVAKVRATPAVKQHADALDQRVKDADALAGYDTRKFEEGTRVLTETAQRAGLWAGLAKTLDGYAKERTAAVAALAALDKHAAAARVKAERDAARQLITDAANFATLAEGAPDPATGWATALTTITRARADLAVAQKLADGLGTAGAAEVAAANPKDTAGLKKALDRLRADGKAAAGAANAKQAQAQFKTFDEQAAAAAKALTDGDGAAAAKALGAAAAALVEAKTIQAGHGQFVASVGAVEAALKALKASKRAVKIKGRIDPIETALTEAKAKDAAHDAGAAMTALRRANDAVAAAKAADTAREKFDGDAAALDKRVDKVVPAGEKTALQGLATAAVAKADAFAFADAQKALDAIEVRIDKGQLEAMMKAKPDDPKIVDVAKRMVKKGGATTVDDMIQNVPDGGDMRLLNALAEGRYGIKFKSGAPLPAIPAGSPGFPTGRPAGDPAKSMKVVCKMFSEIPQDIVKNKSITSVSYEDSFPGSGGAYQPADGAVSMEGRTTGKQKFGANQENRDPKTNTMVKQLPAAIDPECQPVNTDEVVYLAFAAAHEVAHGMDDSSGFMARNGSQPKYGGWIVYGSSVQPLADIVGADARHADFYKTPEQRRYVLDKLQHKPAVAPTAAPGSDEDKARIAFDKWFELATAANVYRRQGDCDAIKIGDYIYHEAYARSWVGYLAAARKKALTGYQFRAPGEWFAELYAGFRSGKLKDTHPAMEWLKKL